jgi:hypothetical protein
VDPTWLESFQTPPLGGIHNLRLGHNLDPSIGSD